MNQTQYVIKSFVMGYHDYQKHWKPKENEILECEMEPSNVMDKYAVAVKNEGKVVGHLMKGEKGNFAKMIFYFLRADDFNKCQCKIVGKPVNLGNGMGLQVPCELLFTGRDIFISKLKNCLS